MRGGRTQPNDARERCADRLEVRVDCRGRGRGAGSPRELAAQWCAYEGAHLLDGEFWFGEEVAEFREGALSKKRKKGHAFTFVCREEKRKGGLWWLQVRGKDVPRASCRRLGLYPPAGACGPSHRRWRLSLLRIA